MCVSAGMCVWAYPLGNLRPATFPGIGDKQPKALADLNTDERLCLAVLKVNVSVHDYICERRLMQSQGLAPRTAS